MNTPNTPESEWNALVLELNIERVVDQAIQFKAQLEIGEDAYWFLRMRKVADLLLHGSLAGVAGGATVATPVVAGTFFPAGGILGVIGLGTAVTPIGWVIGAGALSATVWITGKTVYDKLTEKGSDESTERIPKYLNTPLDALAVGIFEMTAPLALSVANADGEIGAREKDEIGGYFIRKWGYNREFVRAALRFYTSRIENIRAEDIARCLVEFLKALEQKRDCNACKVLEKVAQFLQDLNSMNHGNDRWNGEAFRNVEKILLGS